MESSVFYKGGSMLRSICNDILGIGEARAKNPLHALAL